MDAALIVKEYGAGCRRAVEGDDVEQCHQLVVAAGLERGRREEGGVEDRRVHLVLQEPASAGLHVNVDLVTASLAFASQNLVESHAVNTEATSGSTQAGLDHRQESASVQCGVIGACLQMNGARRERF